MKKKIFRQSDNMAALIMHFKGEMVKVTFQDTLFDRCEIFSMVHSTASKRPLFQVS